MYSAIMDVPHYWTADQVQRLLDALASHNRHQARTAALIMWRTGLRVSEVLELEWRDLDYSGRPATLLVRKSKSRRARTVRMHGDLVQLFANWPANRCGRRCGTLLMVSSGLVSTRSRPVRVSGVLALTACAIVRRGIGWLQVGSRSTWSASGLAMRTFR